MPPATALRLSFSNWRQVLRRVPSRSTWTDSLVRVNRILFLDFRFEAFLDDSRMQFFHSDLPIVKSDLQQVLVPFVADQLNTRKP